MANNHPVLMATILVVCVAMLGAADTIIVRFLSQDLHPFVIVFFRSVFGLLFVAPWILRERSLLKTSYFYLHIVRAGLKMLSLAAFFVAIAMAALADVTAIAFTTPVFLTIGAWIFLNEKPVTLRIVAVIASFTGVLVILQPGQDTFSTPLLFALAGAFLTAVIQLLLKIMSARDSTDTLVAWNLIVTVPMAAIPLLWFWTPPSFHQYLLLALQGVAGATNMAFMARALSLAQASYLAPFDFLRLPTVGVLAYLFFGEVPTAATLTGAIIIFASTLLLAGQMRR